MSKDKGTKNNKKAKSTESKNGPSDYQDSKNSTSKVEPSSAPKKK